MGSHDGLRRNVPLIAATGPKAVTSLIRSINFKCFVWSAVQEEDVKRRLMGQIKEFIEGG